MTFDPISIATWQYEVLHEGQSESFEKTIEDSDIDAFAAMSGDFNPTHMDVDTAIARGFRGRVAHGVLLLSYVSRILGVSLPGRDCLLHSLNMRFRQPVVSGDTIRITLSLKQKSDAVRALIFDVSIINTELDEIVASGKAQVGVNS